MLPTMRGRSARVSIVVAVELSDDVARLDAGLVGRTARLDAAHQRALRLAEADRFGDVLRHLVDRHADAAAR